MMLSRSAWWALKFAIGALLLWLDLRFFLLYLLAFALHIDSRLNRLRAMMRTYHVHMDIRWLALLQKVDVSEVDLVRTSSIYEEYAPADILDDWNLASNGTHRKDGHLVGFGDYSRFLRSL